MTARGRVGESWTKGTSPINPSHYREHPSGIECIQISRHMGFNLGQVQKYIWRQGLKSGSSNIQDLKKARWYLNDEIAELERQEAK